jgi:regulator of protease activity HflC (stomatin/prohibitin superfamily)
MSNQYKNVVIVLLIGSLLGTVCAVVGGIVLVSPILHTVALLLGLSTAILGGVVFAQKNRTKRKEDHSPQKKSSKQWFANFTELNKLSSAIGIAGGMFVTTLILFRTTPFSLSLTKAAIAAFCCLCAAALASIAVNYLGGIDAEQLPEANGLTRLARVVVWVLTLAAFSMIFAWIPQLKILNLLFYIILTIDFAICYGLFSVKKIKDATTFPLGFGVLSILGRRKNIFASILDSVETQLGIDLRSTWALSVIRKSFEPVIFGLLFLSWLSTSISIIGVQENGLVERFGAPVKQLTPGIHIHWPWPIDRAFRIPLQQVQVLTVGHEGSEGGGPEDVIWASEHAPNEYTLLLGNGRDLITVDAGVQFRISDAHAWKYHFQNPADALRVIAHRAVMRSTVNRTLSEALSENVVQLTNRMREMVQQDADSLGLGVEVVTFTVGGMHPPVSVASEYQAVVSAELRKVTAVVNAQVYRNQNVPAAEASVLRNLNAARAEGAENIARANGEAWSFRTLEAEYNSAPVEFRFRRRLETLESGLGGHGYTIVDARIQRDGGELWLMQ